MYFCSRQLCFKELKNKLILLLKHAAQRSHSEARSLKKCTLPYIYFVFKCLVLYFGIKKEWLEKKMNTFSLAANILKPVLQVPNLTLSFGSGSQHLFSCSVLVVEILYYFRIYEDRKTLRNKNLNLRHLEIKSQNGFYFSLTPKGQIGENIYSLLWTIYGVTFCGLHSAQH